MDYSKVKLVVSDMDGTLLSPKNEVRPRFFKLFKKLKQQNIHFIAASGRQYQSILDKLYPIKDDISIIAENGGIIKHNNQEHVLLQLTPENIKTTILLLRKTKGAHIVLCGKNCAYIESNDMKFIDRFKDFYTNYTIVNDLLEVKNDVFLKIAVFHHDSSEKYILPTAQILSSTLKVIVSGKNWLDISHAKANKSYALEILQKELGVSKEETMAFGDYNNDLEMLDLAYFSFAMENAHADVKKTVRFTTKSNAEEGVEHIIEKLLKQA